MIQKYASGAAMYTSMIPNFGDNDVRTTTTKDDSETELISKSLLEKVIEHGIESDVAAFFSKLSEFERKTDFGGKVSTSEINALKVMANKVRLQKLYFDRAISNAEKQDALGEIAVSDRGELFVFDSKTGKVKEVSAKSYDIKKHGIALTVSELIQARTMDANKFDMGMITAIGNSIGMSKINSFILSILSAIGESTTTSEAYQSLAEIVGAGKLKMTKAEFEAIQEISQGLKELGPNALFKITNTSSSKNIKEALNYIYNVLPRNMLLLLQGRYVAEGGKPENGAEYIKALITGAVATNNKVQNILHVAYLKNASEANGSSGSGSSKTFYSTPNELLFDGNLNRGLIEFKDPAFGNMTGIKVHGTTVSGLTSDDGHTIASDRPMSLALNDSIGKYLDYSHIFMGEQKLYEGDLQKIAYSRDPVSIVNIPVNSKGDIDFASFHGYSAAEEEIRQSGANLSIEDKNKIHRKHGSFGFYDNNGLLLANPNLTYEQYALTYGYTIDDHIADENRMVQELTGNEEDAADALLEQIYTKKRRGAMGYENMPKRNSWDDIFRVPVFIKVAPNASMNSYYYGGHGSSMSPQTLEEDMSKLMSLQLPTNKVVGNTSILYNDEL